MWIDVHKLTLLCARIALNRQSHVSYKSIFVHYPLGFPSKRATELIECLSSSDISSHNHHLRYRTRAAINISSILPVHLHLMLLTAVITIRVEWNTINKDKIFPDDLSLFYRCILE